MYVCQISNDHICHNPNNTKQLREKLALTNPSKNENHHFIGRTSETDAARLQTGVCTMEMWTVKIKTVLRVGACNKHRRETIAAVDVMNRVSAALWPHVNHIGVILAQIRVQYLKHSSYKPFSQPTPSL